MSAKCLDIENSTNWKVLLEGDTTSPKAIQQARKQYIMPMPPYENKLARRQYIMPMPPYGNKLARRRYKLSPKAITERTEKTPAENNSPKESKNALAPKRKGEELQKAFERSASKEVEAETPVAVVSGHCKPHPNTKIQGSHQKENIEHNSTEMSVKRPPGERQGEAAKTRSSNKDTPSKAGKRLHYHNPLGQGGSCIVEVAPHHQEDREETRGVEVEAATPRWKKELETR